MQETHILITIPKLLIDSIREYGRFHSYLIKPATIELLQTAILKGLVIDEKDMKDVENIIIKNNI